VEGQYLERHESFWNDPVRGVRVKCGEETNK